MALRGLAIPLVTACFATTGCAMAAPVNFVEVSVKIGATTYEKLVLDAGAFNADGRLENDFSIWACDGSVRLALEACDGSVREAITVGVSATDNPGQTVSAQVTGKSVDFELAVAFATGFFLGPGVYDLMLKGIYEFERLRDPDLPILAGTLTAGPSPDFTPHPDDMLSGRLGGFGGETRVTHGSDVITLPEGQESIFGDVTSFDALSGLAQVVCPDIGCGERVSVIAFSTHNPEGVLRRLKLESTLTTEPGTPHVIALPATGLLLLGGLAGLGFLRRRHRG